MAIHPDTRWGVSIEEFHDDLRRFTPDRSGRWGGIEAVKDPSAADYHVVLNSAREVPDAPTVLYCLEPPVIPQCEDWDKLDAESSFPAGRSRRPQLWHIGKGTERDYDFFDRLSQPEKSRRLSWITTDKGRDMNPLERVVREGFQKIGYRMHERKPLSRFNFPTDGHILRMKFLDRLVDTYPGILDLYGRGDFTCDAYRGPLDDKWAGCASYKYSLAVENYQGPNYFSEKVVDPLLAWSVPIYWGCTNLEEYLPEESFIRIDIEANNAPERLREILENDDWEQRLDAVAEARRRILNEYQLFPTIESHIAGL
ncbi:glycosyltransferase family 10 domain-containing protein [Halorubrum sp. BV1]|uniref:glycosyltransferase family 10 domain-containing protein n=1 Tax=Halorubrum sp. BV1 TaxID=1498500 RepID=UPI0018AD2E30|nr:glycosyltransferase family 10 [Halorubrum sp. BV1]